jgi:serine/threonine-protein kinase
MELDGQGRLRGFSAVPYPAGRELVEAIAPEAVFLAAQLDFGKFTEVPAKTVPVSASDELRAWKGPHPVIPNTDLTVEVASWRGRLTYAKFVWPWMKDDGSTSQNKSFVAKLRGLLLLIMIFAGLAFASLLARRNWKQGRVDRRGALRIALAQFGLNLLVWIGRVHAVPNDAMVTFFFNAVAQLMLPSFLLWLVYIALEPALRSRWPHSIVTWNRVLAGRWLDPQVGAHILIGAAVGIGIWTAASLNELRTLSKDGLESGGYLFMLEGARQWLAAHMSEASGALQSGFIVFFLIFGLRTIFRKDWIAAVAGSFLFAFVLSDVSTSPDWPIRLVTYVVIYSVIIGVLLRFGLLVTMVSLFFLNTIGSVVLGTDWKTWYAATGFATMALLLSITLFAFSRSLGSRSLIGDDGTQVN